MADFKTLFTSATQKDYFLVKPDPSASTISEAVASQKSQAEQALKHLPCSPTLRHPPNQVAVEAETRVWLSNLYEGKLPAAYVQRLLDSRFESLGCYLYPYTRSAARSLALNKLVFWTFVLDDVIDDPQLLGQDAEAARCFCHRIFKAMFSRLPDIEIPGLTSKENNLDSDALPEVIASIKCEATSCSGTDAPRTKALQDLVVAVGVQWVEDMRNCGMSHKHLERARETVADYMLGIVGCARLRQEKRLPSLDEYTHLRRMEGGGWLNLICCEFSLEIELDDKTWEHPLIKQLAITTANHLLWMNDLLAFKRECENEDYITLLAVLHYNNHSRLINADKIEVSMSQSQAASFENAIFEARALIEVEYKKSIKLGTEIAAWRPDLQPFYEALDHTVTGLTFWTLWSQRYQGEAA